MKNTPIDLHKFHAIFGMDAARITSNSYEYRVQNLDISMHSAREIIKNNNLKLVAETTGYMAQIRSFIVKEID